MKSQQELDAIVSMIMVNLPFPPMPMVVRRGSGEEDFCSSHDLMSRAISCSMIENWNAGLDSDIEQVSQKQQQRMKVLIDLNHKNATLHAGNADTQAVYDLFAEYFRKYMAFYPGSKDIRIMPMDRVDDGSIIYSQAMQHLEAKRINTDDHSPVRTMSSYTDLISEYSRGLYLENQE
jgi:hypothetical protein